MPLSYMHDDVELLDKSRHHHQQESGDLQQLAV